MQNECPSNKTQRVNYKFIILLLLTLASVVSCCQTSTSSLRCCLFKERNLSSSDKAFSYRKGQTDNCGLNQVCSYYLRQWFPQRVVLRCSHTLYNLAPSSFNFKFYAQNTVLQSRHCWLNDMHKRFALEPRYEAITTYDRLLVWSSKKTNLYWYSGYTY